ncbi:hypothetical protein A3715_12790 [Oleiphilus sp. HI0009]|nr:hypothetical protein A3715_12790 [Oleiphilus sp. HI0009]MCH2158736.1 DUF3592 domain-containing protein [Oleiphilaceae bacterium]
MTITKTNLLDRYYTLKFNALLFFRYIKWPLVSFIALLIAFEVSGRCVSIAYQYASADIDSETIGKIVSSGSYSGSKGRTKRHNILYEYKVDGVTYTSRIIDYEYTTIDASSKIKQYYVGRNVRVLYDSTRPALSVLEITPLSASVIIRLLIALLIPFIVVIWQIDWKARAKRKR